MARKPEEYDQLDSAISFLRDWRKEIEAKLAELGYARGSLGAVLDAAHRITCEGTNDDE